MSSKLSYIIDVPKVSIIIIKEQLEDLELKYLNIQNGEIELTRKITKSEKEALHIKLKAYGISLIEDRKDSFVEQIKSTLIELVYSDEALPSIKTSEYLEKKLLKSYSSIARAFKEETYSSIENFIILHKVERAKDLMISNKYTLTEIAHMLNYSSVAHLSGQFKKTTGLSASAFVRILKKRREAESST